MKSAHPILKFFGWCFLTGATAGLLIFCGALLYLSPKLPPVEKILDIQLQIPLRVHSADGALIAEFGEKKRTPITFDQIPTKFIHAILAAEDARFYSHHGVDPKGLTRAFIELATTGSIQTGGSTITMQVAKNYFLSRERTFLRKFNEILLALQMERELEKNKILELYVNKIYLGHRAYGIEAAANVYYGKSINELNLPQLAMIAGLPKAPSAFNPITNPSRAIVRRDWILSRMLELEYIDQQAYQEALAAPITAELHGMQSEVDASYLAEMVRKEMYDLYGADTYTEGYRVYTTINSRLQDTANQAVQQGLIAYDQRHGYRGPEGHVQLPEPIALLEEFSRETTPEQTAEPASVDPDTENGGDATPAEDTPQPKQPALSEQHRQFLEYLDGYRTIDGLVPGLVLESTETESRVLLKSGRIISIPLENAQWARTYYNANERGPKPDSMANLLKRGDIIRTRKLEDSSWQLAQIPTAQAALLSLNPRNGAVLALVGGFDFQSSKYNRVIQAGRQAGSSFKPFIYSAALEHGLTPATVINDAPVVFEDQSLESTWRPENSSGRFYGPTRLRQALYKSRNLVSIRVLREIGPRNAIRFAERFGFSAADLPDNLSLALGSAAIRPWDLATGYAVFANGGYKVEPWFIDRIESNDGEILFKAAPITVCEECEELAAEAELTEAPSTEAPDVDSATTEQLAGQPEEEPRFLENLTGENPPEEETRPLPVAERVIDKRIAYLMTTMLQDVIRRGTGTKALQLNRPDIAGKTGTTNDQKDAWFSGFNPDVVTTVWVGFDAPETLGRREYGGTAALPIWIDYMREALADSPVQNPQQPEGITTVKIDPETGKRASAGQSNAIFEQFRSEHVPQPDKTDPIQLPDQEEAPSFEGLF
ncbi:MAG: penicillin-binding protein 1A [Ketobacteraceae bacterium]|nr:penicillin-binding protein 1A [Ketobacteraceae bacterium]